MKRPPASATHHHELDGLLQEGTVVRSHPLREPIQAIGQDVDHVLRPLRLLLVIQERHRTQRRDEGPHLG